MKLKNLYRLDAANQPQVHKIGKGCKPELAETKDWGSLVRCCHGGGRLDFWGYASWQPAFKERVSEIAREIKMRVFVKKYLEQATRPEKVLETYGTEPLVQFEGSFYENVLRISNTSFRKLRATAKPKRAANKPSGSKPNRSKPTGGSKLRKVSKKQGSRKM